MAATPPPQPLVLLQKVCTPGDKKVRLTSIDALRQVLLTHEQRPVLRQHFPIFLQRLEPLLGDADAAVRKQVPALLGALGAAQQPEMRGFFAFIADAAQRTASSGSSGFASSSGASSGASTSASASPVAGDSVSGESLEARAASGETGAEVGLVQA